VQEEKRRRLKDVTRGILERKGNRVMQGHRGGIAGANGRRVKIPKKEKKKNEDLSAPCRYPRRGTAPSLFGGFRGHMTGTGVIAVAKREEKKDSHEFGREKNNKTSIRRGSNTLSKVDDLQRKKEMIARTA